MWISCDIFKVNFHRRKRSVFSKELGFLAPINYLKIKFKYSKKNFEETIANLNIEDSKRLKGLKSRSSCLSRHKAFLIGL